MAANPFVLCAPVARPVTCLHIGEPGADLDDDHGAEPLTLCGLPMCRWDAWVPITRRPGDRICPACVDALGQGALALLDLMGAA